MSSSQRPVAPAGAEQAINAILDAEQRSREQLDARRAEATQIVANARAAARRIHERADARSVAMHGLAQDRAAVRSADLEARTQAVLARAVQADAGDADLAEAVARVAAELTGGGA